MTSATRQNPDAPPADDGELAAFATMLRLRRFEEKAGLLYALGLLGTPCPLGVNQEGALAAVVAMLRPEDVVLAVPATPALALTLGSSPADALRLLAAGPLPEPACLWRSGGHAVTVAPSVADAVGGVAERADPVFLLAAGHDGASRIGNVMGRREISGRPGLAILVTSRDELPEAGALAAFRSVHEIDGTDAARVASALVAARTGAAAGPLASCILILTPPYRGHARSGAARRAPRMDAPDPLTLSRRRLLETGAASDAQLATMDQAMRDEIAAAAQALALPRDGPA